ncbi:MAG: hypothetical protein KatS3mg105_4157 [Gemmatales bacterium]|nr:MAG: hypothetical protein KatS3mg105_4157 [Gemmatales bacterium]
MAEVNELRESNDDTPPSRRRLLAWFSWLFSGAAAAAAGIPILGYLLGPARRVPDVWLKLCGVKDVPVGQTRLVTYVNPHSVPNRENPIAPTWDGMTSRTACYVRHKTDGTFDVLSVNCTHLGCPVSWFAEAGLFMCPCHGGVYYEDGAHASGPPPRGLYRYEFEIRGDALWIKAGHLPTLQNPLRPDERRA